jgi:hypothetical protein
MPRRTAPVLPSRLRILGGYCLAKQPTSGTKNLCSPILAAVRYSRLLPSTRQTDEVTTNLTVRPTRTVTARCAMIIVGSSHQINSFQ